MTKIESAIRRKDVEKAAPEGLRDVLYGLERCIVAASGGVDSLTLAVAADRLLPGRCRIIHATSPAVPGYDSKRVRETAKTLGLDLGVIETGEFADPEYINNPVDRCRTCKSHLYAALQAVTKSAEAKGAAPPAIVSGANTDDLGEYRPGLDAAGEFGVRHPYIEAGMGKEDIRKLARDLGLPFADLPASPCLASRIYTGTQITPERLAAVEYAEKLIKKETGLLVVRCRIREAEMLVEVESRALRGSSGGNAALLAALEKLRTRVSDFFPFIKEVRLDREGYRPGRAFIQPS